MTLCLLLLIPFILVSFFLSIVRHELSHALVAWLHGDSVKLYPYPHRSIAKIDLTSGGIMGYVNRFSLQFWRGDFFWGAMETAKAGRKKSDLMSGIQDIMPCFTGLVLFFVGAFLLHVAGATLVFPLYLFLATLATSQGVDGVKMLLQSFRPKRTWIDVNKAIRKLGVPRLVFQVLGVLMALVFLAALWFWVLPVLLIAI